MTSRWRRSRLVSLVCFDPDRGWTPGRSWPNVGVQVGRIADCQLAGARQDAVAGASEESANTVTRAACVNPFTTCSPRPPATAIAPLTLRPSCSTVAQRRGTSDVVVTTRRMLSTPGAGPARMAIWQDTVRGGAEIEGRGAGGEAPGPLDGDSGAAGSGPICASPPGPGPSLTGRWPPASAVAPPPGSAGCPIAGAAESSGEGPLLTAVPEDDGEDSPVSARERAKTTIAPTRMPTAKITMPRIRFPFMTP